MLGAIAEITGVAIVLRGGRAFVPLLYGALAIAAGGALVGYGR